MDRIGQFLALLRKWNSAVRLTGNVSDAALDQHVAEAMTLPPYLEDGARVIDVGSGNGFPAIPIALVRPDLELTLVEPIAKKVSFLRECRRVLKLDKVQIIRGRDDELRDSEDFERRDVAISQATFAPLEWIARGRHLVRDGGVVIAMLGASREGLTASEFAVEIFETEIEGAPPRALAIHHVERST